MARFDKGWIKGWRKVMDSDLVDNVHLWGVWHWLLYSATWKPSKVLWNGKQREVPAGTVVFGLRELAEKWECSRATLSKWLHYLHDTGRISLETCPRGSIVTVCNWAQYQTGEQNDDQAPEHELNTGCTRTEHELTLSKEGKKGRSKYPVEFESIYETYPRREGKSPGFKTYAKLIKTPEDQADLRKAIENYKRVKVGKDAQFLLMFSTFMNQWTDWLDERAGTVNTRREPEKLLGMEDLKRGSDAT